MTDPTLCPQCGDTSPRRTDETPRHLKTCAKCIAPAVREFEACYIGFRWAGVVHVDMFRPDGLPVVGQWIEL